jgi:hypothetical protein
MMDFTVEYNIDKGTFAGQYRVNFLTPQNLPYRLSHTTMEFKTVEDMLKFVTHWETNAPLWGATIQSIERLEIVSEDKISGRSAFTVEQ